MAETTVEVKSAKLPPLPTQVVNRNTVDLNFVSTEVLRGEGKGSLYLAPEVTKDNIHSVIDWMGVDETAPAKVGAMLRILSQGWWEAARDGAALTKDEEGNPLTVDESKAMELFVQYASSFAARGEKISDLENRLEEIVTLMSELEGPEDSLGDSNPVEYVRQERLFKAKFNDYASQVKSIQLEIQNKQRKKTKKDNGQ